MTRALILWLCLLLVASAQVSTNPPARVSSATVFEWDPVTTTTDGEPVTCSYELGAFLQNTTEPLLVLGFGSVTNGGFGDAIRFLPRNLAVEVRVRAFTTDLVSPWSTALLVFRHPGLAAPQNVREKK